MSKIMSAWFVHFPKEYFKSMVQKGEGGGSKLPKIMSAWFVHIPKEYFKSMVQKSDKFFVNFMNEKMQY